MLAESRVQKLAPNGKPPPLPGEVPSKEKAQASFWRPYMDLRVWPRVRPGHEQKDSDRAFCITRYLFTENAAVNSLRLHVSSSTLHTDLGQMSLGLSPGLTQASYPTVGPLPGSEYCLHAPLLRDLRSQKQLLCPAPSTYNELEC